MDDIGAALGAILNNPQTMQQIMSLASQLGMGEAPQQAPAPTAPADTSPQSEPLSPAVMPAGLPLPAASPSPPPAAAAASPLAGLDMNALAKVMQMMGSLNQRDRNVELLLALKPHFGEKRQKKVDDAIRIMQLIKMLPLLKETGIFDSLAGN